MRHHWKRRRFHSENFDGHVCDTCGKRVALGESKAVGGCEPKGVFHKGQWVPADTFGAARTITQQQLAKAVDAGLQSAEQVVGGEVA